MRELSSKFRMSPLNASTNASEATLDAPHPAAAQGLNAHAAYAIGRNSSTSNGLRMPPSRLATPPTARAESTVQVTEKLVRQGFDETA
jgi:hypothetical protein